MIEEHTERKPSGHKAGSGFVSIVIIDDNVHSLEYLSNALARDGVQIFAATNAEQGLDRIYAHRPHIVLSDVVMPGKSGLDVLRCVKEFDPAIDVIMMSARDAGEWCMDAIEQGAIECLSKPITLSVLRSRVAPLIENHIGQI